MRVIMIQILRPQKPLRVWWKKCGTRNDSSAGSRPDRQARGGILSRPAGVEIKIQRDFNPNTCFRSPGAFPAGGHPRPPKAPSVVQPDPQLLLIGVGFVVRLRRWIPQPQSRHRRPRIWPSTLVLRSTAHRPSRPGAPAR
jgi:hypothetical protein